MNSKPSWSRYTRLAVAPALLCLITAPAIASPPTQPGKPTGAIVNDNVTLSWQASTDNTGIAGYNVYIDNRYTATVSTNRYTGRVSGSGPSTFYVVAFDTPGSGEVRQFSAKSIRATLTPTTQDSGNQAVVTPAASTNSAVPTAATSLNANRTSGTTVTLSWSPARDDQGIEGYNVYRDNQYVSTVKSGTSFNDSGLQSGREYTYYVVAFDEPRNFSPRSAEVSTASANETPNAPATPVNNPQPVAAAPTPSNGPDTQSPSVVRGLTATLQANGSVLLSWIVGSDNVGVVGYNLYRNGAYFKTVFTNSFTDSSPPSGNSASYSLAAFDAARNYSPTSRPIQVSLSGANAEQNPAPAPVVVEAPVAETPGNTAKGNPPTLRDPQAAPTPSPSRDDPFGTELEIDNEQATAGGPPTQPKNLRAELVSNNWAEINWAPSNDDGNVVEYRIYRSDGVIYTVRGDQTHENDGTQNEINRFWNATLFIDCNYTRFYRKVHNCVDNAPSPGDTFVYQVSAIDNDGQESARSAPLEVVYHTKENAPIPYYNDFYKDGDDLFVQEHDLSRVDYFLDDFVTVFADEFNGSEINSDYWNTRLTWGDGQIINGEQQYFVPLQEQPDFAFNPFNLTGSSLIIESIVTPENVEDSLPASCSETDSTGNERCLFLSGALSSHDKFGITYGYVESRMKVGGKPGMLSSFYLYNRYPGTGKKLHGPEIDIVEYLGENPYGDEDAFQTYHYRNPLDGSTNSAPSMKYVNPTGERFSENFHTFGVLWEPQLVIWYVDGKEVNRMSGPQVARQRMNIVAYLVAGSEWAPTPDVNADIYPLQFEIDYIRAYQRPPFNTNGLYPQ